jgi:hypothetical protein
MACRNIQVDDLLISTRGFLKKSVQDGLKDTLVSEAAIAGFAVDIFCTVSLEADRLYRSV